MLSAQGFSVTFSVCRGQEVRRCLYYGTITSLGHGLCTAQCSEGRAVLFGRLDPSGIVRSSGVVLGRFCLWLRQVCEMCVFQVSCLGEQDDHFRIPVYSKAGPSSCCTINKTLAVHSITDQCISFSCIFIIVLFVFYVPFSCKDTVVLCFLSLIFRNSDSIMKVIILKVDCNSCAHWRTHWAGSVRLVKNGLQNIQPWKMYSVSLERCPRALLVGRFLERGAKSFSRCLSLGT